MCFILTQREPENSLPAMTAGRKVKVGNVVQ